MNSPFTHSTGKEVTKSVTETICLDRIASAIAEAPPGEASGTAGSGGRKDGGNKLFSLFLQSTRQDYSGVSAGERETNVEPEEKVEKLLTREGANDEGIEGKLMHLLQELAEAVFFDATDSPGELNTKELKELNGFLNKVEVLKEAIPYLNGKDRELLLHFLAETDSENPGEWENELNHLVKNFSGSARETVQFMLEKSENDFSVETVSEVARGTGLVAEGKPLKQTEQKFKQVEALLLKLKEAGISGEELDQEVETLKALLQELKDNPELFRGKTAELLEKETDLLKLGKEIKQESRELQSWLENLLQGNKPEQAGKEAVISGEELKEKMAELEKKLMKLNTAREEVVSLRETRSKIENLKQALEAKQDELQELKDLKARGQEKLLSSQKVKETINELKETVEATRQKIDDSLEGQKKLKMEALWHRSAEKSNQESSQLRRPEVLQLQEELRNLDKEKLQKTEGLEKTIQQLKEEFSRSGESSSWKENLQRAARSFQDSQGSKGNSSNFALLARLAENVGESSSYSEARIQEMVAGKSELNGSRPSLKESILNQLKGKLSYFKGTEKFPAEMRMSLKPPSMGDVLVRVFKHEGKLTAEIMTETAAAREMLESNLGNLKERFQQMNLNVERTEIYTAPEDLSGRSSRQFSGDSNEDSLQRGPGNRRSPGEGNPDDGAVQEAPGSGAEGSGIELWA